MERDMNGADEMTCKELVELVTDYFEGALSAADKARFELHLQGCSGCRNYMEQMRETVRLTGKVTEESLSPVAQEELLSIFRGWKKQE
jgi:predicted anti-sigma-YlaC factor YlaD